MNDERVVDEIVTKFLLDTCQLCPKLSKATAQAAVHCVVLATRPPIKQGEGDCIPLITGSVAEYYIEPMIPHICDIDVMYHLSTQLAIPEGHPPPTQLPAEFDNYVKVYEIVDSHLPCYVYLELRYLLTECVDDGKYNAVECDTQGWHLSNWRHIFRNANNIHGPAVLTVYPSSVLSSDFVRCVYAVSCGRHKPLIGQHDTETTTGQTQQLLIVLSATDVMWLVWHIVSVDTING